MALEGGGKAGLVADSVLEMEVLTSFSMSLSAAWSVTK